MDRWDLLVLTAGDQSQKKSFELHLASMQLHEFIDDYRIFADYPVGAKIGAGGATLVACSALMDEYGANHLSRMRVLMIHTGGYSQRQPNASALGKLFTVLPRMSTINPHRVCSLLEAKLETLRPLLSILVGGVFIAASDTLEYLAIPDDEQLLLTDDVDFLLLAHPSTPQVGINHGVYVLQTPSSTSLPYTSSIIRILQKPSIEEMHNAGAIWTSGNNPMVFTDSAYFMSHRVVSRLVVDFYRHHQPISVEIDCYGDFLRPLGSSASREYISIGDRQLSPYRSHLFDLINGMNALALVLPNSAFYHIGTSRQLLEYLCVDRVFERTFGTICHRANSTVNGNSSIGADCRLICSHLNTDSMINSRALIEFCRFEAPVTIDIDCILSGCHVDAPLNLVRSLDTPPILMSTIAVRFDHTVQYVTVAFELYADLKKVSTSVHWFGKEIVGPISLWDAKLFPVANTMQTSFAATLAMITAKLFQHPTNTELVSMRSTIQAKDVVTIITYRQGCEEL